MADPTRTGASFGPVSCRWSWSGRLLSTTSVNHRGPPSLPRAELGVHGLNRWTVKCWDLLKTGMVQKQVTTQGWLMSTPEGDAPDPTLTRWGLAGCRQLDPQPSRSCHSRRSACWTLLIPCGPSWSLSRLPAGPVLRSPLLVRLEMASTCMHDTPRNATFSGFLKISAGLILVASQSSATTCIHVSLDCRGQRSCT